MNFAMCDPRVAIVAIKIYFVIVENIGVMVTFRFVGDGIACALT